jgi:hypothetical protein
MTIKQISLLIATIATAPIGAMDRDHSGKRGPKPCPNNVRGSRGVHVTPFVNNGVVFNAGEFSHHGPFVNLQGAVVVNSGSWNSGNIPQPQYPQYYPQHPYAQPPVYLPAFYGARNPQRPTPPQNPQSQTKSNAMRYQAQNRPLTTEEQTRVKAIEELQPFSNYLSKEFQGSVGSFNKLNQSEKSMVATTSLVSRLEKDEKAQDVKRVMHVFSEEDKSPRLISPNQPTTTENKSLFFVEPKAQIFDKTVEQKSLWHTSDLSQDTIAVDEELTAKVSTWDTLGYLPKIS